MQFILMIFSKYGLFTLFVLIALEYACFPLPSEVVLPFLGYIANANNYKLIGVIMMSLIIGYLGCLVCYLIGYYGGSKLYNKLYNKWPSWQHGLDSTHKFFYKYGNFSVMIGRVVPMCRTYVSFFAGIFKQNLFKYSVYSLIGIMIWNVTLITLGYYLADKWGLVGSYYGKYKFLIVGVLVIGLITFFIYKMYKKGKKTKTINGD